MCFSTPECKWIPSPSSLSLLFTIGGARIEGRGLCLWYLLNLAEHLTGGGLVEPDRVVQTTSPDGIQQSQGSESINVSRVLAHLKGYLRLGGAIKEMIKFTKALNTDHIILYSCHIQQIELLAI